VAFKLRDEALDENRCQVERRVLDLGGREGASGGSGEGRLVQTGFPPAEGWWGGRGGGGGRGGVDELGGCEHLVQERRSVRRAEQREELALRVPECQWDRAAEQVVERYALGVG
jgi:hypothetical protein